MVKVNRFRSFPFPEIYVIFTHLLSVLQLDMQSGNVTTVPTALKMYGGGKNNSYGEVWRDTEGTNKR